MLAGSSGYVQLRLTPFPLSTDVSFGCSVKFKTANSSSRWTGCHLIVKMSDDLPFTLTTVLVASLSLPSI